MMQLLVLYGSRACEHDVSIITGVQALSAADPMKYDVTPVYIDREGRWFTGEALRRMDFYTHFDEKELIPCMLVPEDKGGARLVKKKTGLFGGHGTLVRPDCALLCFHGMNGEDGTVQGLLELYGVPYTSAGVLGSATGMDKIAMKLIYRGCGLPVTDMCWFERADWEREREEILSKVEREVGYPAFVKPANLGSSIGINIAHDRNQLEDAIETAAAYDHRILVEKAVSPLREVNCSVLGYGDHVETSELEMPVTQEEFLTFRGKYMRNAKGAGGMASQVRIIPAPISEQAAQTVRDLAVRVFRAMDLKGVVRIDFILDQDENVFINEANTIPGSLAFYLWEPKGISFSALLDGMVECAFSAWADRKASVFSHDSTLLANIVHGSKGAKGKLSR